MNNLNVPEFLPVLSHGAHGSPQEGACVMEMVSFLAGEEFTDQPRCVAAPVRTEAIQINDLVSDDNRNVIALMIPRFMETESLNGNSAFVNELAKARRAFLEAHELESDLIGVSDAIKKAFNNDEGDKRRTNQEYDQIGIDWLNAMLDIVDKHLGRDSVPEFESYIPSMKVHPSQAKVNA